MNEKELSQVKACLTAEQLRALFDRLHDEATPYALTVAKSWQKRKGVTIRCDAESEPYFRGLLQELLGGAE